MRKSTASILAAAALTFGPATAVMADNPKTIPPDTTISTSSDTTTTKSDSDGDSDKTGLWGLLGLVGLAGLAGLKRRDDYANRDTTYNTGPRTR